MLFNRAKLTRIIVPWLVLCPAILLIQTARSGDEPSAEASRAQRQKLERFQQYVGEWRGVGQPKRGSSKDAWSEECQWIWSFHGKNATLTFDSPKGKYVRSATLQPGGSGEYELKVKSAEGSDLQFTGEVSEAGELILVAANAPDAGPSRITMRVVAGGDRLLMLYERRVGDDRFTRLGEVGFTRKGSGFGQGTNYVECVVTGGVGTIPVTYEGKTYYVCCTGCRDHFNDNPAEVLAEYRERKEAEKKKKPS
jgi:hypothetical protein